jgi:hypothetical protein
MFKPKEEIASLLGKPLLMDQLLFVSRGRIVEKLGAYDDNVPEIVYSQGNIINMSLLVNRGNNKSKNTIYCHEESNARIVYIEPIQLQRMMDEDKDNLMPLYYKKTVY